MHASDRNPPPEAEAAATSSPDVNSLEEVSKNTSPPIETTPSANQFWTSPDSSKAAELHHWLRKSIVAQTHLQEEVAALIAFWVLSTWFQDALMVLPCLLITGSCQDAVIVLRILEAFCRAPLLAAEFRRGDLDNHYWNCHTLLMLEPNLNNKKAALLGNLTNSGFRFVADGRRLDCSKSRAVYIGTNPATQQVQNAIHITIPPTNAESPRPPAWLKSAIDNLPSRLYSYREQNLDKVRRSEFIATGVPSETAAIAKALGKCVVDAPKLQEELVVLLKTQDREQLTQRSGTTDGLVVEAILAIRRLGRERVFSSEIAAEANRLLGLRGESLKLSPETVGRRLSNLGLRPHRLTNAANGLTFDNSTISTIQMLAAMYVGEDLLSPPANLHYLQTEENKKVEEVVSVV